MIKHIKHGTKLIKLRIKVFSFVVVQCETVLLIMPAVVEYSGSWTTGYRCPTLEQNHCCYLDALCPC